MAQRVQAQGERDLVGDSSSSDSFHLATIVVGLGNPILGDDGVGWHVAKKVLEHIEDNPLTGQKIVVDYLSLGGLSLMEHLIGYDRAVIIDAIDTGILPLGSVRCLPLEELPDNSAGHITAVHDTSLQTALHIGRAMEAHLPQEIIVVGIESPNVYDFSEELSPAVAAAVPTAVEKVLEVLYQDS